MADNQSISSASSFTAASDDVSGVHYQKIKLADGTADSTTMIVAGEGVKADALRVCLPTDAADVKVTLDSEAVAVTTVKPDGTNTMPSLDTAARRGYVQVTDGTNSLPTGDARARAIHTQIGDASNGVTIRTSFVDNENNSVNSIEACAHLMMYDGATWDRGRGDATDGLLVNLGSNNDVVQATASNLNAQVVGVNTNDSPVTGNPLYIGGRAATTPQSDVSADGDFVPLRMDRHGCAFVQVHESLPAGDNNIGNMDIVTLPSDVALADDAGFTVGTTKVIGAGHLVDDTSTDLADENDIGIARMTADRRQIVQLGESGAKDVKGGGSKTDTSDQAVMSAGGAGVYNYLQWVTLYNASTTNTYANIKDGSTVVAVIPLPAYGGAVFCPPRPIRGTANTAWNVAAGTGVTTAYFYGGGYTATA